jgi:hypothetical protein
MAGAASWAHGGARTAFGKPAACRSVTARLLGRCLIVRTRDKRHAEHDEKDSFASAWPAMRREAAVAALVASETAALVALAAAWATDSRFKSRRSGRDGHARLLVRWSRRCDLVTDCFIASCVPTDIRIPSTRPCSLRRNHIVARARLRCRHRARRRSGV